MPNPQRDPIAFLQAVESRAAALRQYRVTFVRQERLGVVPSLQPVERMTTWFRAEPFSVKFEWQGDDSEFREAAWVDGQHDGKVLLLRRHGLLGFKPGIERHDPQAAVTFGKSRNPITDFGLYRMIHRTLLRIDGAKRFGGADVRYVGTSELEGVQAHHFEIAYPKEDEFPNKRQDLYIEAASGLPVGVYLWLPNGDLDAMYLYLERQALDAPLDEQVFAIHGGGHGKSARQKGA